MSHEPVPDDPQPLHTPNDPLVRVMTVQMTHNGDAVTIHTDEVIRGSRYVFRVTWCSRWDLIDAMANAGQLERVHYGANTYGHCEYFYP